MIALKHTQTLLFCFQLFSSFYVYGIAEKLAGAESILMAMGYQRQLTSQTSQDSNQELRIEGEVDLGHMAKTAADLVILQCDLELLRGNAKGLAKDHPELQVRISDILLARGMAHQTYKDTYEEAITRATSRQFLPPGVPEQGNRNYPPKMTSAECYSVPEDLSAVAQGFDEHQYERRKSVDQTVPWYVGMDRPEGLGRYSSAPNEHKSEKDLLLARGCGNGSTTKTASMPEENSWNREIKDNLCQGIAGPAERLKESEQRKESWESSITSPSSLANSMSISYSQDIPRPDPNDLPEPVFDDEGGFTAGGAPPFRHVSSSDMSCDGSRVGLYINSSSADDDPLNMLVFSPDDSNGEKHRKCFGGSERVEADGPDSNDPATTNISKTVLNSELLRGRIHPSTSDHLVEASRHNQPLPEGTSGHQQDAQSPDDSKDSLESEGKRSLASPLNSIGEKRKRDSPYTSLPDHDDSALQKASPHTSISEGVAGKQDRTASPLNGGTGKMEDEQRWRSHHISEKSKEDYVQKGVVTTKTGSEEKEKNNALSRNNQSSSNQWVCKYCTFINSNDRNTCEVCEIPQRTW